VHRIDLNTGKLTTTIPVRRPGSLVVSDGAVWLLAGPRNGRLFRIDTQTNTLSPGMEVGKDFFSPQFSEGSLWVINLDNGRVRRFDPSSTKMLDEFSVPNSRENNFYTNHVYFFAAIHTDLWVTLSGDKAALVRIDANTHQRIAKIDVPNSYFSPVFWNDFLWLSSDGDTLTKVDPSTNHMVGGIALPTPRKLAVPILLKDADSLWVFRRGIWAYSRLAIQRIRQASD